MTNYVRDAARSSPINMAVARILLALYLLWKILSYDWRMIAEWPMYLRPHYLITPPEWATVSVVIATASLLAVLIGYRIRLAAFIAAVAISHLGFLRATLGLSGSEQSIFIAAYLLVLFALFSESDRLTVDTLRSTQEKGLTALNDHLKTHPRAEQFELPAMKYGLLVLAIVYFGSGIGKITDGPGYAWIQPESLARYFTLWELRDQTQPLMGVMGSSEPILWLSTVGTLVLELGLLVAAIAGVAIWPILLGLAGMHVVIALGMGPLFMDQLVFLALFVPWDQLFHRIQRDDQLDLVYDEHCFFCTQSLNLFPFLDSNGTLSFYSQYTAPDEYRGRDDTDFESAMFAFREGQAYRGYWAFRELLRQFRVFAPVVWLMGLSVVSAIGEHIYEYIAENRGRHFTCSVDLSEQS